MSKFLKNNKMIIINSILIPLIITFAYDNFINRFINFIAIKFFSLPGSIVKSISNAAYRVISNGNNDYFSMLLFVLICTFFVSNVVSGILDYKKQLKIQKNSQSISTITNEANDSTVDIAINDLTDQIDQLKNNIAENEKVINKQLKKIYFLLSISIFIATILYFSIFVFYSYTRHTAIRITNNIEIVSPYISDLEYKTLKSNFYSLSSKQDYDELVLQIEKFANENNLKLK